MCGSPRVYASAPVQSDQEHDQGGGEQEHANPIERPQLLEFGLPVDVQKPVGGRVVEEEVEDDGEGVDDDS